LVRDGFKIILWLAVLVALCEVWINGNTVRMLKYQFVLVAGRIPA